MLLEEKALSLEKTDTQFAELMKDYQNGIFIFKLQEEEVWNKVKVDSIKLYDFYQKNMQNIHGLIELDILKFLQKRFRY